MPDSLDSSIEIVRPDFPRGPFCAALFDFDGTLSLLRRNWQDVMIPMMVDLLARTPRAEDRDRLREVVEEFVMRLNGRQTIYQMMQLAEQVEARGGAALEPLEYKHQYHDLLWRQVAGRIEAVRSGASAPCEAIVPDARRLLEQLSARGLSLVLASGTDLTYVRDELAVLELDGFFGPHVYGALDEHEKFSKAQVIRRIISERRHDERPLLVLGDGFVEIEEAKRVGGLAIGVASEEVSRQGVNAWKRNRLIEAGADIIIGDYRQQDRLLELIGVN